MKPTLLSKIFVSVFLGLKRIQSRLITLCEPRGGLYDRRYAAHLNRHMDLGVKRSWQFSIIVFSPTTSIAGGVAI
jgi:hypothetical protein